MEGLKKAAVIGAGISGMVAARSLRDRYQVTVFEKEDRPGGLIRCREVGGSLFHTCGGHVFNSRRQDVMDWFWGLFDRNRSFVKADRNAQIVMPENYVAMFAVPKPSTARKIIRNAEPKIVETIRQIAGGKKISPGKVTFIDRMKSRLINPLFYRLFVKADGFFTTDDCTGCGICAQLCPLRNITIVGEKPVWGQECTHCMACICRCPAEAVEYGKKSEGKPRYYFEPERKTDYDEPE